MVNNGACELPVSKSSKLRAAALPASTDECVTDAALRDHLLLLDALPYGVLLVDKSGTVRACNPIGRVMFRYRNADIVGMNSTRLVVAADRKRFRDGLQAARCAITI